MSELYEESCNCFYFERQVKSIVTFKMQRVESKTWRYLRGQRGDGTARSRCTGEHGKIRRVHGGAIATRSAPPGPPITAFQRQPDAKRRIGQAAGLVSSGDTLFLGSGTTVLEVAHHLHDQREITVLTNSLLAVNALVGIPNIQLVCLVAAARVRCPSSGIYRAGAPELRADKVIIGIEPLTKIGLTNDSAGTQTDRAIMNIGRQVIVVADHSKCAASQRRLSRPSSIIYSLPIPMPRQNSWQR
jgi:DeoR/GlpR family transcriptional regulator of sugar metabolism